MKEPSEVVACFIDHSIFLPVAQKLSEQLKHVYYWSPHEREFETIKESIVGDGFGGNLERVNDFWDIKHNCDLFVFCDIGFSGLQKELVNQGFPVWGGRDADIYEVNRGKFLGKIGDIGLDVPQYFKARGITELSKLLRDKTDKWIKVSRWRGDVETFHWRDWANDEATLDCLAFKLGPAKELPMFYVLDPIEAEVEDGVDTYCIDGKMPSVCLHAMECKDKALLGTMVPFDSIPEKVRHVSETFAPVLAEHGYRNFFSTEVRITKEGAFFIDPTLRAGSPPSQLQTELFANLGELIWAGANGECVDPVPTAEFGVQALLTVKGDRTCWTAVVIPEKLRQWVKCGGACQIDDRLCQPPDECRGNDIGWLVAIGDTIEKAIEALKEHAADLPDGVCCDCAPLAELLNTVESAEEEGMEFTSQHVPEPATVLE
jgi:hypothetical protein